ncbi:RodZ domain-containing protein [Pseudomonas matsuisoli]|uniref:Helix-turn-helix domain-containing protein n=1 Tax=Pseudomonas matsuisoli TaxID=1515666 RepID=A0A917UWP6_9PSED|nr:RodZ family helix-turn-helix domain-containing protein [Pseudomonas matsuisoli]GGJ92430.1 helix-turn-helix domain-containing protein [Pseudomonas matsuisoli]
MKPAQTDTLAGSRNPGESLRNAREARGLSCADAARQLNLTETSLQHIETGAFDRLPGHTFARGYVRAYAKFLGLDQTEIVREFDQFTGTNASGSAVHSLGRIEEPSRLSQNLLRLVCFALLVLLGVIGFFWWQEQGSGIARQAAERVGMEQVEVDGADGTTEIHTLDEPEDQAVADAQIPADVPATTGADVNDTDAEAEAPPNSQSAPAASPPADTTVPNPVAPPAATSNTQQAPVTTSPTAAPSAPATAPAAAAVPGQGSVKIVFTADCWTQVMDADRKVLSSRLQRKGDTLDVSGKAPLSVRLGYARGAEVTYNGESVDVMSRARGETATLTLGQ